jgi:hypothetical protein
MQERPIRPHQAIKPKIGVSAGGKATITSLPIITSRDYRYSLSDLRTWLVYLQKITEHNEPFMPTLMKASTYITVRYRNGTHALSRCMDNVQPRTFSVWMEYILASHEQHAGCTRMKHVATHNSQTDAKMGSVEWITPSTLAIPVMRNSTRIKHVAHLVWLCRKVSLT